MADEKECTDIKVQLESLRKDVESVNSINNRLDTAIDKLTDVSTSIKSMLAVHEEKIQRQEQIDDIIFDKLKERADEITCSV
jgi:peptidoglycan hydrolase CwlO-like protein